MPKYLVTVKKGNDPQGVAKGHGVKARKVWKSLVNGFSAEMTEAEAEKLRRHPHVERVEEDDTVSAQALPWNIDRVDQRLPELDGVLSLLGTGKGVTVYVIDTGGTPTHQEFQRPNNGGSRVRLGFDAFGGDCRDRHGHGTHCMGTVGGNTVGLAREAELVAMKGLDDNGFGSWEGVVDCCEWAAADAAQHGRPAVVSMSLGGPANGLVNDAVRELHARGITVVVAAGNSTDDAWNYSPASAPEAICVGATTLGVAGDERAWYSNWGSRITVFAPGSNVVSAAHYADDALRSMSGTSMACPGVAGAAAIALQTNPTFTPDQVRDLIQRTATQGVVQDPDQRESTKDLLYARMDSEQPPDEQLPNLPPVADFTWGQDGPMSLWFESKATDDQNDLREYRWAFGNGFATWGPKEVFTRHTYVSAGSYTVEHEVIDGGLLRGSTRKDVTVGEPPEPNPGPDPVPLREASVTFASKKGVKVAQVTFSGFQGEAVEIYAGDKRVTVPNNGAATVDTGHKGKPPQVRVCEVGGECVVAVSS